MRAHSTFLSTVDWLVLAAYLALGLGVVAILERWRNPRGGVPRPVVGLSLAMAELSGLGLVAVPGLLLSLHGNLAYLQWVAGAVVARLFLTFWLRRMAGRHGEGVFRSREVPWFLVPAEILVLSARTMVAALPLQWMTSLPFHWCLLVVAGLVGLSLLAGKQAKTVVWGEAGQAIVIFALLGLALVRIVANLEGGWDGWIASAAAAEDFSGTVTNKWGFLDFRTDPSLDFTFWTALLAYPFLQCQLFLADRGMRSRLDTCAGKEAAIKALWWSLSGQMFSILLLLIGMALWVHYRQFPITDPVLLRATAWEAGEPGRPDPAFWLWLLAETGAGWKGGFLGAFLLAAVSGLHGQLLGWRAGRAVAGTGDDSDKKTSAAWWLSRLLLLAAAGVAAWEIERLYEVRGQGLLGFAYGLLAYSTGPLLALALIGEADPARLRKGGLMLGTLLASLLAALVLRHHPAALDGLLQGAETPGFDADSYGGAADRRPVSPAGPWLWPTGFLLGGLFAWRFRRKIN